VRDAVSFARLGIPAIALVTSEFWEQGHFVARSVGMPDVPRFELPHPVAGTGLASMALLADRIADELVATLLGLS
jgi:hypothetical protein